MISGISSSSDYSYLISNLSTQTNSSLSYEQEQTLDEVLSNYDSSSLTVSDAQEIVSALQEAGIEPSKALEEAMSSLGFDAAEIGQLAGLQQPQNQVQSGMPPPPPPSKEEEDSVYMLIEALFANSSDSENSFDNLFSNNDENTETSSAVDSSLLSSDDSSSIFVDMVTDYTSRILNLNDSAKQSVMDLFDKYSNENSDLSTQETATLIKAQLSEILSDTSNYNHSYMYA